MLIAYLLLIVLNFLFLRFFGTVGVVSVIVIDLAVLLYLLRDRLGNLSIRAGLRELSKGRLDYRIDTSSLTGESLEMAQAVNEMGDGLQEAVDAMVNSERLKAELITNLSHDLKTPLTSIINYVDLLKREEIGNERAKGYIEILERKSNRLKSLITDLIDVSRISSGNVELHITTLDLHAMVQMAVGEFEDRFQEKGLTTEMEAARALPVSADGDMLWRVLDNLLGNIAKYAMPGSTVRIRIFEEAGKAVASFENQSKEKLEKSAQELEERFVRGDESRSSEGSGLGLSIAGSLTELMGGMFRIETTQTTFCATLQFDLQPMP
jgi:signal transduction histidine kinase